MIIRVNFKNNRTIEMNVNFYGPRRQHNSLPSVNVVIRVGAYAGESRPMDHDAKKKIFTYLLLAFALSSIFYYLILTAWQRQNGQSPGDGPYVVPRCRGARDAADLPGENLKGHRLGMGEDSLSGVGLFAPARRGTSGLWPHLVDGARRLQRGPVQSTSSRLPLSAGDGGVPNQRRLRAGRGAGMAGACWFPSSRR